VVLDPLVEVAERGGEIIASEQRVNLVGGGSRRRECALERFRAVVLRHTANSFLDDEVANGSAFVLEFRIVAPEE
jgi:hypothetical protein